MKPGFFKDEDIAELPFSVRLFFCGLWTQADKRGRLEDRPKRLKIEIIPYDNFDIEKALQLLAQKKKGSNRPFIIRYEIEGEKYIQIVGWSKHQRPHHTEVDSIIPPPLTTPLLNREEEIGMGSVLQTNQSLDNVSLTVKGKKTYPYKEIVSDLNTILSTSYKPTSVKTQELIRARIEEGFTLADFKIVHRKKFKQWENDRKMSVYLRPQTLYAKVNFEGYLNQKEAREDKWAKYGKSRN